MILRFLKSWGGILILSFIFVMFASVSYETGILSFQELAKTLVIMTRVIIFLFLLPLLTIKYIFKEKPNEFGWCLPENKKQTICLIALAILIFVPIIIFFSYNESFQSYYQLKSESLTGFLFITVFLSAIYYFCEEFMMCGFLFWGLWRKLKYHSFWITSLFFALFHITKPGPEIVFSFFISLVFCYLSLKTKSFVPAAVSHFVLAFLLNFLVNFYFTSTPVADFRF